MTLEYYLYLYSCYFWNTNIFGYSFGKYVASEYIRIFIRYIMWHPNIFRYSFVSILWYSLITGVCHCPGPRNRLDWQPLVEEHIAPISKLKKKNIFFLCLDSILGYWHFFSFGVNRPYGLSCCTSLLCIVGELAEGRSVAVGVGDRRQILFAYIFCIGVTIRPNWEI